MTNADLNDMTRDELRAEAKRLEIAGRGQMRKPDLIAAIEAKRNDRAITGMAEKMAAKVIELRASKRPDPVIVQSDEQMSAYARLIDAMMAKRERKAAKKGELVPNRAERRTQGQRGRRPVKPVVRGKVMPIHHRGRAIGAKHLNIRVAAGRSNEEFLALTVPSVAQEQPGGAA